jgi:hypothetical protein
MRDYTNMPTADWADPKTVNRAKAQLMRAEPLVLNLPGDADLTLDDRAAGCHRDDDSGVLWNCQPGVALHQLGSHPGLEGLTDLVGAAETGDVTVDIDTSGHRIVFHD